MKLLATVLVSALLLAACGKKEVSFDTLETARNQAKENALFNAQNYRAENPRFTDHKIVAHGDSTQTPECPQGDGWASLTIMSVNGKDVEKYKIKCSTVSANIGCFMETDFLKKPYAAQENRCQPTSSVPFPIPKLVK